MLLTSASVSSSIHHRLPKLDLPVFEGDVLEWQSFWYSYETGIHTNQSLSDFQRSTYLKSLLKYKALQTVSGFAITNVNYCKAVLLPYCMSGMVKNTGLFRRTCKRCLIYQRPWIPYPAYGPSTRRQKAIYEVLNRSIRSKAHMVHCLFLWFWRKYLEKYGRALLENMGQQTGLCLICKNACSKNWMLWKQGTQSTATPKVYRQQRLSWPKLSHTIKPNSLRSRSYQPSGNDRLLPPKKVCAFCKATAQKCTMYDNNRLHRADKYSKAGPLILQLPWPTQNSRL